MSNYLQSKWKIIYPYIYLYIYAYIYLCLTVHCALAIPPQKDITAQPAHLLISQAVSEKNYWQEAQVEINKLVKSASTNKNVIKIEKDASSQATDFRQYLINRLASLTKGYIYDPEHPEKFFDQLIAGYEFVTGAEKQLISYGEQLLGDKNKLVIEEKARYSEHKQYLDALKQQRQMITKNSTKK